MNISRTPIAALLHLTFLTATFHPSTITQAQVTPDGTLGPTGPLAGPDYAVTADLGTQAGNNLFHSFAAFNLTSGESATFSGPANINNILARVTGGLPSSIDGTLRSDIAGANLLFINPAGVIFGPNAALDITGSFTVTTTDTLHLADSGQFHATDPAQSLLTTAAPSAFGFLNNAPAPITVNATTLATTPGQNLSLVAGPIQILGGTLQAPGGRINSISVASTGQADLDPANPAGTTTLTGFSALGDTTLFASQLNADGLGGGPIVIRAGALTQELSLISSQTLAAFNGQPIDIEATGTYQLTQSAVLTGTFGTGHAADIHISADHLNIDGQSTPLGSAIRSQAFGPGDAGAINIHADNITLANTGNIGTTTAITGLGGSIHLDANDITLDSTAGLAAITSETTGLAPGANIYIDTASLTLTGGGLIGTTTTATAAPTALGGSITINSDTLNLSGTTIASVIATNTLGPAPSGDLTINAPTINLAGRSILAAETGQAILNPDAGPPGVPLFLEDLNATGTGGSIDITTDHLSLTGTGAVGLIPFFSTPLINSVDGEFKELLQAAEAAFISTSSRSPGHAGNLTINAHSVDLSNGSTLNAIAFASGNAGNITLTADTLSVSRGPNLFLTGILTPTISGQLNAGDAGNVMLDVTDSIHWINGAFMSSDTIGPGKGGNIHINTNHLLVDEQNTGLTTWISASTLNPFLGGPGGNITIETQDLTIQTASINAFSNGPGAGGRIDINTGRLTMAGNDVGEFATITASVFWTGNGGDINITADDIVMTNRGLVVAAAFGPADSGNIHVTTNTLMIDGVDAPFVLGGGFITGFGVEAFGDEAVGGTGGLLRIDANSIHLTRGGIITGAATGLGVGGNIIVNTNSLLLTEGGVINSIGTGLGGAGNIEINTTGNIQLTGDSEISTSALLANGGDIDVLSSNIINLTDSEITAEAAINGGNITLSSPQIIRFLNSSVTATAGVDGGNIMIDRNAVILDNTSIIANAVIGTGGDITILADVFLSTPSSVITASSEFGLAGNIAINSPDTDLAGSLAPLPDSLAAERAELADQCANRLSLMRDSYLITTPGGLPTQPDGWLPAYSPVITP